MSTTPMLADRHGSGVGDGVRGLIETAIMLPVQWEPRHAGVFATGAGHLVAAVLESAVHEYQLYRDTKSKHRSRYAAQAKAWFVGAPVPCCQQPECRCDACYLYSFVNCCETLGIDADQLRRAVLDGRAGRPTRAGRMPLCRGLGPQRIGPR